MTLEEAIAKIKPLDHNAMEIAQKRWDSIAKPLHSLGKLETHFDPDRRELQETQRWIFPGEV